MSKRRNAVLATVITLCFLSVTACTSQHYDSVDIGYPGYYGSYYPTYYGPHETRYYGRYYRGIYGYHHASYYRHHYYRDGTHHYRHHKRPAR